MTILQSYFIEIIVQLIRIQNQQLIQIICKNENIEIEDIQDLVPSAYEINKIFQSLESKS